ncbi:MAG: NAD(P)H-hydrate epimerase [Candidatus Omnitrophota bacterium]|nr:MAG: NAD(P)H-hydrate epimerase [Candidatus Omnitrophota bacterium]
MTSQSLDTGYIRALEKKAKDIGLSERMLIENASSNLYEAVNKLNLGKRVAVIAGRGNNGADVLSCARKLASRSYKVKVIVLGEKELGAEAVAQQNILEQMRLPVKVINSSNLGDLNPILEEADFILEGILGIGIKGEVSAFLKEVINRINSSNKKVVACDIPSGLSPDEGKVLGAAVRADYTVTFIAAKKGFLTHEGPSHCGKVIVTDIGISKEALQK